MGSWDISGSWDRLPGSSTSALQWLFGVIAWFNSQPQIIQLFNQKHHDTFWLFHAPLLLLPQTQLLALFLPPSCHPQSCPLSSSLRSPTGSAPSPLGTVLGAALGWGMSQGCRASLPCKPSPYLPVAGRKSPPMLPALPASHRACPEGEELRNNIWI